MAGYLGQKPTRSPLTTADLGDNIVTNAKLADDAVGTTDIADDAVSLAKMASGTDGNIITYDASGNPAAVATGTVGQILTSAGAGAPPTFAAAAAGGKIVQVVNNTITSANSGTTQMPIDNTIPTSSEGNEFITLAITPTNASNKLLILINLKCGFTAGGSQLQMALFQDSTSAAIAANATARSHTGEQGDLSMNHYMTAGTTIATTFKVRVGANIGGTMFLNSNGGGRLYGGVSSSTITIMEIAV